MLTTCLIKYPIYDGEKSSVGRVHLLTDSWKRVSAMKIKLFNIQQHIHNCSFCEYNEMWKMKSFNGLEWSITNDEWRCWGLLSSDRRRLSESYNCANCSYFIQHTQHLGDFECRAESRTCSFILLIDLNECKNMIFFRIPYEIWCQHLGITLMFIFHFLKFKTSSVVSPHTRVLCASECCFSCVNLNRLKMISYGSHILGADVNNVWQLIIVQRSIWLAYTQYYTCSLFGRCHHFMWS